MGKIDESDQKVQTASYKISYGDIIKMGKAQFPPYVTEKQTNNSSLLCSSLLTKNISDHQMCGSFSPPHQTILCYNSWVSYNLTQF